MPISGTPLRSSPLPRPVSAARSVPASPSGGGRPTRERILSRSPLGVATVELGGARTLLTVPLLKEGKVIGGLVLYRTEVRPFDAKQVELLSSFADQAVIAIENARLFEAEQARTRELTESLQQQTATAEVLKVISRSAFDLQMVLDTLTESACRLCDAYDAVIVLREGEFLRIAAHYGDIPVVDKWPVSRRLGQWTFGGGSQDHSCA